MDDSYIYSSDPEVAEIQRKQRNEEETPSSVLSEDEALDMGILQPEEEIPEGAEYEIEKDEREFKKLGFLDTAKDVAKSIGVEALHLIQPKAYETQYISQTHFGENMKYLYRYGVGMAGFMMSGGALGGALAGVKGASLLAKGTNVLGKGLRTLLADSNIIKTGVNAPKALKVAAGTINGAVNGLAADLLAQATLSRPEEGEGHLADSFGETNNAFISFLQTKEDDTDFDYRLKNVIEAATVDIPLGGTIGGAGAVITKGWLGKLLQGLHGTFHAQTAEEAGEALTKTVHAKIALENVSNTMDLVEQVDLLRKEAIDTGEELSQLIIDKMPPNKVEEAKEIASLREMGEEIYPYSNGTWSVKVNSWQDAYKVTPEQYKEQVLTADPLNGAISQMDKAVENTWRERKLIDGDGLYSDKSSERINTTTAVLNYYKNKFDLGKTKITVKYGNWQEIPDGRTTQYKNGNIFIQINKGSKDIYAALRSELEHARDLIKGEKPDQSIKHFARYEGLNEAEMSPYYVHKKSVSRALKNENKPISKEELDNYKVSSDKDDSFGIKNPDVNDPDYEPYTVHSIKNKEGQNLAYIQITKGNYINWTENHGVEKGAARKLIAKLLYENKYPTLIWEATTKKSVESYEKFCREFPDLVDRIQFTDRFNISLDIYNSPNYTQGKGVLNEGSQAHNSVSGRGKVLSGYDRTDNPQTLSETGGNKGTNGINQSGILDESGSTVNERGNLTDIDNETGLRPEERRTAQTIPSQLTFDPAITAKDIGADIAKGNLDFTDSNTIKGVFNHLITNDIEISGRSLEDIAKEADKLFYDTFKDDPVKAASLIEAQDSDVIDKIVRHQLASTKLLSVLKDIQAKAKPRENLRIFTAVKNIEKYIENTGSALGSGLNAQKITKRAMATFGVENFSDLALEGINEIADILDSISLNFTRGQTLKEFKAEFYKTFKEHPSYLEIAGDDYLLSKLNDTLEESYKGLKQGKKIDNAKIIQENILQDEAQELGWYAKLCDNTESFRKTIANGARKIYIANILGVASACKNITSAVIQGTLHPTYKILGGLAPWNLGSGSLREGVDEITSTLVNLGETMRLAKQAFINGEGVLVDIRNDVAQAMDIQKGFHKWNGIIKGLQEDGFGITFENLYTIIPRMMMCTDEFASQLMYRNIVRAKALRQARKVASSSEENIKSLADNIFQSKFNSSGQALDMEAAEEVKNMLFQTPLDRKLFSPKAGKRVETGEPQTLITKIGELESQRVEKLPFLAMFEPFIKTPFNIANESLRSNPAFMLVNSVLNKEAKDSMFSSNPLIRAKMQGKFAFMLALGAGACATAAQGFITGSPPLDTKEKIALYKTGWKPYSFKIGDKYVSYMGLITPLDGYLAFCADSVALYNRNLTSEQEMSFVDIGTRILGMIINDYIDQSGFRGNAAKLMDIVDPSSDVRTREQLIANVLSGALPWSSNVNAVRGVVKNIQGDTEQRKPENFYEHLFRNYSDVLASTQTQDYKRDVFGHRIDQYGILIARLTDDNFMQPEYQELARLAEFGYTPSNIGMYLKKTKVPLTSFRSQETGRSAYDAMYDELQDVKLIRGKTLQQATAELIQSKDYLRLPDGINTDGKAWASISIPTKTKLLDSLFLTYYEAAKMRVIGKRGKEFVDENGMTLEQKQRDIQMQMLSEFNQRNLDRNITHQIMKFQ